MLAHWMLGCITFWQGEFAVARRELESAVSLYEPLARHGHALALQIDPAVNALLHLSWTLWIVGHPEQGLRTADRAVGTARALSQPYSLAMALFWAALTQASCGRHASAQNALDELMTLTAEHGFSFLGSCARVLQAQELTAQDRCAEALQLIDRAFAEFRTQEAGVGMPWAISISAAAYARMGRTEAGLAALAAALQAVERNGERHWEAELWRLKGELLLQARAGVGDEAEVCLRTAIELAQWQGARSLELRAVTSLARLLLGRGEATSARHMLAQTLNGFSEGGDTADHLDAKALLDASL
jgi:tetratricopeptide (TPR) repeat protein